MSLGKIERQLINVIIGDCGVARPDAEEIVLGMSSKEKSLGLEDRSWLRDFVSFKNPPSKTVGPAPSPPTKND